MPTTMQKATNMPTAIAIDVNAVVGDVIPGFERRHQGTWVEALSMSSQEGVDRA